jgi:hypothetical protein
MAVAAQTDAGWLKDGPFDATLILGVTALAFGFGLAAWLSPVLFLPLLAVHTWAFSFDHVIATFTRLVGTPEDRRAWRFLIWGLPLVMLAATFAAGQLGGVVVIASAYFFLQWFHTVRQSWGIAQHYRRAAGGISEDPQWLSELTMWSVPVWGLLSRCAEDYDEFLWMPVSLPVVPRAVVSAAGAASAALLLVFLWTRVSLWRHGKLSAQHTLFVATHFAVFGAAYVFIDDLHAGWLLVNVWHNVQYLAYVWMRNRARFAEGVRADARILSWLCQPGVTRGFLYFGACLALSTPLFWGIYAVTGGVDRWLGQGIVSASLVFALALNFHHYTVDALIWRRRAGA